ncbi:MAG: murein DD-endopeptidase/murein LD-carboxypeptidase [Thiomicrorhabdus sp.]|nr:MAG: murein DD-endopeptidase/murein LD-carboxypeptidase [Thiomicrorhabdus sp.]
MGLQRFVLILVSVVFLAGCSSAPRYSASSSKVKMLTSAVNFSNHQEVKSRLLMQYKRWKGTPYQYGGTSLSGVDCSAFVQNTYRTKLGHKIPRTTRAQIKNGRNISKSQLRVGDIVFFKTSRTSMHNGIYLGQSQFMHASSSKGVTISSLENHYWQKTYLTSRRIR